MPISIVFFLQLLFLTSYLIQSEDVFDCTGYEDDSYHPIYDADDCRHYWHCIYVNTVYMHSVKRVCPAGTEFDARLRQCETSTLVDCLPPKSPHMPRTSSTTKAWKWRYSKLFSRKHWKPTMPFLVTTRRHPVFDLGDSSETEVTTMGMPDSQTTEQVQVLPFTVPYLTSAFSLEQLSKNLHALILSRHPSRYKSSVAAGAKFFQPGEPENEVEVYEATTKQWSKRTRYTSPLTSTPPPTTQAPFTTLFITSTTTTTTTSTLTAAIDTTMTSPTTSTSMITTMTQPDVTFDMNPQVRMSGLRRRDNMTLYILTSDEHKIRQFSINHTRGILLNCNQLRRRLLGRRRLRDILQTPNTTHHSFIGKINSSTPTFDYNILLLIISFLFFLQK